MGKIVKSSTSINWRATPKVELHRHLDGSVRLETILDHGLKNGHFEKFRSLLGENFNSPEKRQDFFKQKLKILKPMESLEDVLNSFWLTQQIMDGPEILERIAFENVEDCFLDGIKLAELRFSPVFIAEGKKHAKNKFDYETIIQSIISGVEKAKKKYPIEVGLIYIIPRSLNMVEIKKCHEVLLDLLKNDKLVQSNIVGADLADVEFYDRMDEFKPFINNYRNAGLGITIHSGENTSADFLKKTFETYNPQRIGHGIHVMDDKKTIDMSVKMQTHFEVCPTSNILTRCSESIDLHPIRDMINAGLSVSLNSDDPHIMNIDLTHEYELCASKINFNEETFKKLNKMALDSSFVDSTRKEKVKKYFN